MKKTSSWIRIGALLLAFSSVASRFLGLLRDYVFAKVFGIGLEGGAFALDAYFIAFRIPDFLYTLLIFGSVSAAFIPLYAEKRTQSHEEASVFTSEVLNLLGLLLIGLSALAFFFAPYLLPLLAPGFSEDLLETAVRLTRLMLLSPLFLGLSSVLQGVENVAKRFGGMALAPFVYNLSILGGAVFFAPRFGVYALAWAVVLGAFLHFLVQLPGAVRGGFSYKVVPIKWTNSLRRFFVLAIPRILATSSVQVGLLVDILLATLLPLGAVSVYTYALNLQSFPYGVVGVSIAVAVFPHLTQLALEKRKETFVESIFRSVATIFFWSLPAVVGLFLVAEPLIDTLLVGGAFDAASKAWVLTSFQVFIWAALPQSFLPLFARAFYALSDTKTPFLLGMLGVGVQISLSVLFTQFFDYSVSGLAMSNLIASTTYMLLLLFVLKKKLNQAFSNFLPIREMSASLLGAVLMGAVILQMPNSSLPWLDLVLSSAAGAVIYLGVLLLMGVHPFKLRREPKV